MTKQIPTSFIYAMDDFLSFTTKTLEDVTTPYYRGKKEDYPIDDSVKSLNPAARRHRGLRNQIVPLD